MPSRPRRRLPLLAALLAAAVLPLPRAAAQDADSAATPSLHVGGRIHLVAFGAANGDLPAEEVGPASGFLMRRARLELSGDLTDRIAFTLAPSFEGGREGGIRLFSAWLDVALAPPEGARTATLRVGVQKHPFSAFELVSANVNPVVERGAGRGLASAAANDLFGGARFNAVDNGATLIVRDTARWSFVLAAFNGAGERASDENDAKSFGARATIRPFGRLELGASAFSVDGIVGADSASRRDAVAASAAWGDAGAPGAFVLGEVLAGHAFSADEEPIRAATIVAAYHRRLARGRALFAVEPALLLDIADPDARDESPDDRVSLARATLGLWLSPSTVWRTAYELQWFESDALDPVHGLRTQLAIWW